MWSVHHYRAASCCLFEVLAGAMGVELSRTHYVGVGGDHYTAILVRAEEV